MEEAQIVYEAPAIALKCTTREVQGKLSLITLELYIFIEHPS